MALAGDFTGSNAATCTQDAMQAYLEADTAGQDCSSHAMPMPGGPGTATAGSEPAVTYGLEFGLDINKYGASVVEMH